MLLKLVLVLLIKPSGLLICQKTSHVNLGYLITLELKHNFKTLLKINLLRRFEQQGL